jgi:peptidoglycan/LPS O-acetylase OafA/YrhL
LALDGLRGIAILLVFVYHYGNTGVIHGHAFAVRALGALCSFGWSGVDLFFVLSGFLITGILFDTRSDPHYYTNFYGRRALRIFPVFYLFAAVLFFVGLRWPVLVGSGWKPGHLAFLLYVGYPAALIWPALVGVPLRIAHLWSLSLEEQFYMVWPWLIAKLRNPLKACGIAIIGALVLRFSLTALNWNGSGWAYGFLLSRVDSLGMGAAIALLMRSSRKSILQQWAIPGLTISAILFVMLALHCYSADQYNATITVWGISLVAVFYGCLLVISLRHERIFALPVLRMFGKYSYGMYLFHAPLMPLLELLKPTLHFAYVPFCLAVNLAIAAVSFHLFEQPILRLKRRFKYQKLPAIPTAARSSDEEQTVGDSLAVFGQETASAVPD